MLNTYLVDKYKSFQREITGHIQRTDYHFGSKLHDSKPEAREQWNHASKILKVNYYNLEFYTQLSYQPNVRV